MTFSVKQIQMQDILSNLFGVFSSQYFGQALDHDSNCLHNITNITLLETIPKRKEGRVNSNRHIFKKKPGDFLSSTPAQVPQALAPALASSLLFSPWTGSKVPRLPNWTIHCSSRCRRAR